MKVLFVLSIGKLDGGAAAVWVNLLEGLPSRGVEPVVVIPEDVDHTLVEELEARGIPWHAVFYTWWVTTDPNPHSAKRKIARAGARAINARAEREIGGLIDSQGIDIVYICDGTITAGIEAARARAVPVVWHFHQFIREGQDTIAFIDSATHVSDTLMKASRILTVSNAIAADLEHRFELEDVVAIPNGIPSSRIVDRGEILQDEPVVFSLVGRIDANKRQEDAIRAFIEIAPDYPKARLKIIGSGDTVLEERLRELVGEARAERQIELCGFQSDIASVWKETDVALNCSYSEGCSMVVAEAMSSGCFILCSDAEGNREIVRDGAGLLYERCNVEGLAQAMRWVLEHPDQARKMAQEGKRYAAQMFSMDAQLDSIHRVFCEVLT